MIMNFFGHGYEKSVIKFRQIIPIHTFNRDQKRYNLHWVNFAESKHLVVKTSLDFNKMQLGSRFIQEKPLIPDV